MKVIFHEDFYQVYTSDPAAAAGRVEAVDRVRFLDEVSKEMAVCRADVIAYPLDLIITRTIGADCCKQTIILR